MFFRAVATLLVLLPMVTSCTEDELFSSGSGIAGDGTLVKVTLPLHVPGMGVRTRAWMDEEDESRVQDLYVLVFSAEESSQHELLDKQYFSEGSGLRKGNVTTTLPTGNLWIVGVANVGQGAMKSSLKKALDNLKTQGESEDDCSKFEDFKGIQAVLATEGNIDRSTPAMTMCGVYKPDAKSFTSGNNPPNVFVGTNGMDKGAINLQRLDAAVKFRVIPDFPEDQVESYTFTLNSWQVHRIPNKTALFPQAEDNCDSYHDKSRERIDFETETVNDGGNAGTFSFYLLENRLAPKEGITKYNDREAPKTDGEKNDTGQTDTDDAAADRWKYAHKNSTYVEISASMDLQMKNENGQGSYTRHADVKYTVHLGCTYPKGGSKNVANNSDFNTERNTRYTYTVRVKGVDKIVVEAEQETEDDYEHGAEGTVIDLSGGKNIELDAHFAVFNIELTPEEIHKMGIEITSPNGTQQMIPGQEAQSTVDSKSADFQAIRIAPLQENYTCNGNIMPYKGQLVDFSKTYDVVSFEENENTDKRIKLITESSSEHFIPLYDIRKLKEFINNEYYTDGEEKEGKNVKEILTWTVFVSEYVYVGQDWNTYVNKPARSWKLLSEVKTSKDGKSIHISGKYNVTQRSIQTAYANGRPKIVGWEHVNEHQKKWIEMPDIGTNPTGDKVPDATNGWKNLEKYLGSNPKWEKFTKPNPLGDGCYTFKTQTMTGQFLTYSIKQKYEGKFWDKTDDDCYHAVYAALSRNRDLNRNGIIDKEEMLWFLPTEVQYMECIIGGGGMPSPLMRASDFDAITFGSKPSNTYPYHFVGSNNRQLWAEQSLATGSVFVQEAGDTYPEEVRVGWNMRCARYITNDETTPDLFKYEPPYEVDTEKRIITCYFDPLVLRNPTQGALIFHGNFDDQRNTPCYQFQYGKSKLSYESPASASLLVERLRNNFYCNEYKENENGSDRGLWRLPNLRELAILYLLSEMDDNSNPFGSDRIITSTYYQLYSYSSDDELRLLNKSPGSDNFAAVSAGELSGKSWVKLTVIPVRDVMSNK